jgi:hypothetical protein
MRLPGFTAEQSLSWRLAPYKTAGPHARPAKAGTVVPQWFCHGNYCCDEWGNCIYKGRALM